MSGFQKLSVVKTIASVSAVLSAVCALVFLVLGGCIVTLRSYYEPVSMVSFWSSTSVSWLGAPIIGVGLAVIANSFTGVGGIYSGNSNIMKLAVGTIVLMVLVELATGIMCSIFGDTAAMHFFDGLHFDIEKYSDPNRSEWSAAIDQIQFKFRCCGKSNFLDWNKSESYACVDREAGANCTTPDSCCTPHVKYRGNVYDTGCRRAVQHWVESLITGIAAGCAVSFCLQVAFGLALLWIMKHLNLQNILYRPWPEEYLLKDIQRD